MHVELQACLRPEGVFAFGDEMFLHLRGPKGNCIQFHAKQFEGYSSEQIYFQVLIFRVRVGMGIRIKLNWFNPNVPVHQNYVKQSPERPIQS